MKKIEDYTVEELINELNKKLKENRPYSMKEDLKSRKDPYYPNGLFIIKYENACKIIELIDNLKDSLIEIITK